MGRALAVLAMSLLAAALHGCGRIDFAPQADATKALDGPDADLRTCTVDMFDTLAGYGIGGTGTCDTSSSQLVCSISGAVNEYALITTAPRSLVGVTMAIEIVQPAMYTAPAIGPGWHSATASLHFHVVNAQLVFRDNAGTYVATPHNLATHRFLRLRGVDATTTVADYSSDGVRWQYFSQTSMIDITNAYLDLGIDPQGVALLGPDAVIFDNLETCVVD